MHVQHYEWAGFDVCAITDHWTLTTVPSTEHLLVITGAELAVDPLAPGRYSEILAIGIDDIPDDPGGDQRFWERIEPYDFKTFPDYTTAAAFIDGQGGASFIAHPYWSGLPAEVILGAKGVHGLEVFNAATAREDGRGDSSYLWDAALEAGMPMTGIATDDSHSPAFDIGDGWVMVRAAERSRGAVLEALRTGSFYASSGPSFHEVRRDGDAIEVHTSPCRSIVFATRWELGWSVRSDHRGRQERTRILERDDRGFVTRARVEPDEHVPYLRLIATDPEGRSAWTNPVP
jgi:hypothetical protein